MFASSNSSNITMTVYGSNTDADTESGTGPAVSGVTVKVAASLATGAMLGPAETTHRTCSGEARDCRRGQRRWSSDTSTRWSTIDTGAHSNRRPYRSRLPRN